MKSLISDLEFIQNKGTVQYVVDSSEISAYVLPDEAQPHAACLALATAR